MTAEDEDVGRELKDTEQEVMWELKLKTAAFMKKLKEQSKKNKCSF